MAEMSVSAVVDETIRQMLIHGVSTEGVSTVLEQLNSTQPSASTISRVLHALQAEYDTGKLDRPVLPRCT